MKTFKMKNIEWDTDDEIVDLPMETTVTCEDEECAVDSLSDEYGFCVFSCIIEEVI